MCSDFCQQIFEECADAREANEGDFLIGDHTDPISFCEATLVNLLPYLDTQALGVSIFIDAQTLDRATCSFASGLHPFFSVVLALFGLWALVGVY